MRRLFMMVLVTGVGLAAIYGCSKKEEPVQIQQGSVAVQDLSNQAVNRIQTAVASVQAKAGSFLDEAKATSEKIAAEVNEKLPTAELAPKAEIMPGEMASQVPAEVEEAAALITPEAQSVSTATTEAISQSAPVDAASAVPDTI